MSLKDLYRKVDLFQHQLGPEVKSISQCKKGCSQCCKVELSVFSVEAEAIRIWFEKLEENQKRSLQTLWEEEVPTGVCSFLHGDHCSIYEARPLICRTQGLPLRFHEAGQTYVDVCPLNEEMLSVAAPTDVINLDLLNLLLSQLERNSGTGQERVLLRDLWRELLRK